MDRHTRVGLIVACATVLLLIGCPAPEPSGSESAASPAALERDRAAVVEAHEALVRAYERGDVDGFLRLIEPSADLLIFHPRMDHRFDGIDEVRRQIPLMFERLGKARWTDYHGLVNVSGDVAWLTSQVLVESPSMTDPFVGRSTEIYSRGADGWKLIHGHWSAAP